MSTEDILDHGRRIAELERKVAELYKRIGPGRARIGAGSVFASDAAPSRPRGEDPRVLGAAPGRATRSRRSSSTASSPGSGSPRPRTRSTPSSSADRAARAIGRAWMTNLEVRADESRTHDPRADRGDRLRGRGAGGARRRRREVEDQDHEADASGAKGKVTSKAHSCEGGKKVSLFSLRRLRLGEDQHHEVEGERRLAGQEGPQARQVLRQGRRERRLPLRRSRITRALR